MTSGENTQGTEDISEDYVYSLWAVLGDKLNKSYWSWTVRRKKSHQGLTSYLQVVIFLIAGATEELCTASSLQYLWKDFLSYKDFLMILLLPMYLPNPTYFSCYSQDCLLQQKVIFFSFGLCSSLPAILPYFFMYITVSVAPFVPFTVIFPNLFDDICLLNNI